MKRVDISTCHLDYKSTGTEYQDKWIVDLTNAKTNGYFVEAGSYDGIGGSNTYVLEKQLNWQGICVEPVKFYFKELIKNRKICENVCLYSEEKEIEFREFVKYNDRELYTWQNYKMAGFSGINEHIISRFKSIEKNGHPAINYQKPVLWSRKSDRKFELPEGRIIKKQSMTLESLLDKHNAPNIIDYISLDTEGSEYEILKNFPFNKYTIMAFSIEGSQCSKLLKNVGYIEVKNKFCNNNLDYYYIHSSMKL